MVEYIHPINTVILFSVLFRTSNKLLKSGCLFVERSLLLVLKEDWEKYYGVNGVDIFNHLHPQHGKLYFFNYKLIVYNVRNFKYYSFIPSTYTYYHPTNFQVYNHFFMQIVLYHLNPLSFSITILHICCTFRYPLR